MKRRHAAVEPEWTDRCGPRVLVVDDDGASAWAHTRALQRAGYDAVLECGGPKGAGDMFPHARCTLVDEGRCALAEGADVIVFNLALDDEASRAVLRAYRTRLPDIPVCVQAPASQFRDHADLLTGCEVTAFPALGSQITNVVRRAVAATRKVS